MTPATVFVSKPRSLPMPWSSWTTWSPVRRSAKLWSARPTRASERGGRLRKTCVSGRRTRPSSRETKPRRAGETAKRSASSRRELLARLEQLGLDLAEQLLRAERLAEVGERDDDAVARADEAAEIALGLGQAARRDRRPLGLEAVRLAGRELVERRSRRRSAEPRAELLVPDLADGGGLPDEVGGASGATRSPEARESPPPREASARRGRAGARRPAGRRPTRARGGRAA